MPTNSSQIPVLFIENTSGNPGIGFPVKINDIEYSNNTRNAAISLKELIGKTIRNIEVNGSRANIHPPLLVTRQTQLRFRRLMSGLISYHLSDETPTDSDSNLLTHSE